MSTHRYVCLVCGTAVEREFRAPSIVRNCENGCGFDHLVREELLEHLDELPEDDRPDDWEERSAEERFMVALREGALTVDDLR